MSDIRAEWIATMQRYRLSPDRPDNDRFWCTQLDTIPQEQLRALQSEKLRVAVRYAYECIPFYRRKFDRIGLQPGDIRSVDDLPLIPITTKLEMAQDLAEHGPWGTYTALDDELWLQRGWQIFASSGTTAQPRAFRYSQFDREMWMWTNARAMWAMGFRPGRDSALIAFGYGPHVWLWGVHYALNLMGIPILTAGGLDTSARARFIERYKPTILACTPSYALYLASVMRELEFDPAASSIRYLFCAGEPGFSIPSTRKRLEETWNAELHEFYGCTEAAPSLGGYTCAAVASQKGGIVSTHFMEDAHIWEVVDENMQVLPDGERGLTVVTKLCSEASPQLRFLVGDYTALTSESRYFIPACTGPHHRDVPLKAILDLLLDIQCSALSIEAANPRHEHEWKVFEEMKLPEGMLLIPGVIDTCSTYVEHPEVVAQRLVRYALVVGRENVIAGTDCGFGTFLGASAIAPSVAWAKLQSTVEGARVASQELW